MRDIIKRKYTGVSLVEMLLTVMILGVILLLVATTLNTVIKVSNTSNSKNLARGDINYIMDFLSRSISNSRLDNIGLYNSSEIRVLDSDEEGNIEIKTDGSVDIGSIYNPETDLVDGGEYNEIQIKLYGYDTWTCIGYFKDSVNPDYGYIVKAMSNDDLASNPKLCFSETSIITPLHSFMLDASEFSIQYLKVGDDRNSMFIVNATLKPLYWPVSDTFPITRAVSRQMVVSTQALTWY